MPGLDPGIHQFSQENPFEERMVHRVKPGDDGWVLRSRERCASHTCQLEHFQTAKEPSLRANGSRECAPDDRLREAIHLAAKKGWIASSLALLAMTTPTSNATSRSRRAMRPGPFCHRHPRSKVLSLPGWANKAPRT